LADPTLWAHRRLKPSLSQERHHDSIGQYRVRLLEVVSNFADVICDLRSLEALERSIIVAPGSFNASDACNICRLRDEGENRQLRALNRRERFKSEGNGVCS